MDVGTRPAAASQELKSYPHTHHNPCHGGIEDREDAPERAMPALALCVRRVVAPHVDAQVVEREAQEAPPVLQLTRQRGPEEHRAQSDHDRAHLHGADEHVDAAEEAGAHIAHGEHQRQARGRDAHLVRVALLWPRVGQERVHDVAGEAKHVERRAERVGQVEEQPNSATHFGAEAAADEEVAAAAFHLAVAHQRRHGQHGEHRQRLAHQKHAKHRHPPALRDAPPDAHVQDDAQDR